MNFVCGGCGALKMMVTAYNELSLSLSGHPDKMIICKTHGTFLKFLQAD